MVRAFVNDASGIALQKVQQGHVLKQLVVAGNVLTSYGNGTDPNKQLGNTGRPNYIDQGAFGNTYQAINSSNAAGSSGYTVKAGDSLQGIAQMMWGDAALWYRIADANGLSGNAALSAGQRLAIPNQTGGVHNNASTFKPYDPSKVTGDTTPNLPLPPPADQGGGGCGGLMQILIIIIVVVVTIYTAGAFAVAGGAGVAGGATAAGTAAAAGGGVAGTFAAGTAALAGTYGATTAIVAGALGATAGSIVSQGVGIALGIQDEFSWKAVGLAAIGGAVGGGLAGGGAFVQSAVGNAIIRGAIGSALTQGIAVATGLQDHFSWANVAASALGAGVGQAVGSALAGDAMPFDAMGPVRPAAFADMGFAGNVMRGGISAFAGGLATAVARGGKVGIQQIATDAFGNALGSSLGNQILQGGQQEDRLGDFIAQNQSAWEQRQANTDQIIAAFGRPYTPPDGQGIQVADASRFGAGRLFDGGVYTNAAGQRVQTLVDSEVGRPSIDSMLNQASGMAQELTSSAARQAAAAAYARDSAQSTSNLYASGAGDVRGPFYSTSSSTDTAVGGQGNEPESITGGPATTSPAISGLGTSENPIILPTITVTAPRMTQAEMDAFDAKNGSIRAYQPSVWERTWLSPEVRHVMSHTMTGKVVGGVVNTVGSAVAGFRSDGYNFATGKYLNPVQRRDSRIDSFIGLATLPIGMGSAGATRGLTGLNLATDTVTGASLPLLPRASLSNVRAREFYLQGEREISSLNEFLQTQPLSAKERAVELINTRNALRTEARSLMADQELAQLLNRTDPNLAVEQLLQKAQSKGFSGNDAWNYIAKSASTSRPSVNQNLGLKP